MADFFELLSAAINLPLEDRLRLIDELNDTIPDDQSPLSPEWIAEIKRRTAEIEAGTAETIPWETVREDLFRRVGLDLGT